MGMISSPLSIPSKADRAPTSTAPKGMRVPHFFHTTSPSSTIVGKVMAGGVDVVGGNVAGAAEAERGLEGEAAEETSVAQDDNSCFLKKTRENIKHSWHSVFGSTKQFAVVAYLMSTDSRTNIVTMRAG